MLLLQLSRNQGKFTLVCVDGACTLGICAERNAIFNMITNGESKVKRVIAVNWDKTSLRLVQRINYTAYAMRL